MSPLNIIDELKLAIKTAEKLYGKNKLQLGVVFTQLNEQYPNEVFSNLSQLKNDTDKEVLSVNFTYSKLGLFYNKKRGTISGISLLLDQEENHENLNKAFKENGYQRLITQWVNGKNWSNEEFIILEQSLKGNITYSFLQKDSIKTTFINLSKLL